MEFPHQLDEYDLDTCNKNVYCNGYNYKRFVKVSDIRHSRPRGFKLRMVVYVQGPHDGHILLSSSDNNQDSVYEIGKFCLKVKFHSMNMCSIKLISNLLIKIYHLFRLHSTRRLG